MRSFIFLTGIVLLVLGPLLGLIAASSCLTTILSGHFFGCIGDFVFVLFGGILFVIGIVVAIIGVVVPDTPKIVPGPGGSVLGSSTPVKRKCTKCGRVYDGLMFFCPSCGQRPS
jgi:hypothetical protein